MNNDLEQYTSNKIKQLTMAIDQSAFTAIRDGLIKEKAMAEIALKAMQAKPVGYLFVTPEGAIAHSISNVGIEGFKFIGEVYDAPPLNHTEQHMVVPDGWRLVPIEPTKEMVDAHISGMQSAGFSRAYREMLAAAPMPE